MSDPKAWADAQPMTGNLPEVYRENEVSGWLSAPWDDFLFGLKQKIDAIAIKQLDPITCDPEWLDFLAALSGFIGEYWDATWPPTIKRELVRKGLSYLWLKRGTRQVLEYVLTLFFADQVDVWTEGEFRVGVTPLGSRFGTPEYKYFVRLPINFDRAGAEFKLARQINKNYGAFYCDSDVVYDGFYLGFSVCGDPIFSEDNAIGGANP